MIGGGHNLEHMQRIEAEEISAKQTQEEKYWSCLCVEYKNDTLIEADYNDGCRGWGSGVGKWGDYGQKILAFSFKMITFWRSNIHHGDYS